MQRSVQVNERLPWSQSIPLSFQHLFAMFGANVLVPIIFGVDPSVILLMNGIGTLIYILICKGQIPAYLGSSFAFISPVTAVINQYAGGEGYAYALGGFVIVGLVFIAVALLIKWLGTSWIDVVFPPAAMGAIVAIIGLELVPVAAGQAGLLGTTDMNGNVNYDGEAIFVSLFTLGVIVLGNVLFRGFMKIIPILCGFVLGYILAAILGIPNFDVVKDASFLAMPDFTAPKFDWSAIIIILPAALVVVAEHVGHLIVTSNIVGKDLSKDPGLHRSMLGNGISTFISGWAGSTPNTTYGENIGVLALTRVFSTFVLGGAAVLSIILAFFGQFSALIEAVPDPVIGGVSLLLYGVIAASGLRMLVESKIDYSKPTNLILTTIVLVIGISGAKLTYGNFEMKGMALATVVAIVLSLLFKIFEKLNILNEKE
ncbi:uracil permease [Marinicrinis lubricantis]|uniref:Uracil permease n=1 Tax=Marinicrinis lubricantis TaxID=2086470 RepID=A0ABW1ITV4_9BACL